MEHFPLYLNNHYRFVITQTVQRAMEAILCSCANHVTSVSMAATKTATIWSLMHPKRNLVWPTFILMLPTYHIINTQYLVINKTIDIQLYYGNYLADLLVKCVFDMHLNCLAVKIQFLLKISLSNIQSFIRGDWYNIQFISYIFIYLTWYLEMKKKIIISFLDIDAINI